MTLIYCLSNWELFITPDIIATYITANKLTYIPRIIICVWKKEAINYHNIIYHTYFPVDGLCKVKQAPLHFYSSRKGVSDSLPSGNLEVQDHPGDDMRLGQEGQQLPEDSCIVSLSPSGHQDKSSWYLKNRMNTVKLNSNFAMKHTLDHVLI